MTSNPIYNLRSLQIRIDSSQTSYLFIGLATKQADTSSFLGGDEFGWGYIGDRALYHKRAKQKVYGEKFSQGDEIGVTLDMDKGTLSFSRNDEDLGVAFKGLAGELYPAVAFYNQSQRVSLVRTSFDCPKVGPSSRAARLAAMSGRSRSCPRFWEAWPAGTPLRKTL